MPPPLPPRRHQPFPNHNQPPPQQQPQQQQQQQQQLNISTETSNSSEIAQFLLGNNPFKTEQYLNIEMTQTDHDDLIFKCVPCSYDVRVVINLIQNNWIEFHFSWEAEGNVTLESTKSIQLPVSVTKDQFEIRKNIIQCNFVKK